MNQPSRFSLPAPRYPLHTLAPLLGFLMITLLLLLSLGSSLLLAHRDIEQKGRAAVLNELDRIHAALGERLLEGDLPYVRRVILSMSSEPHILNLLVLDRHNVVQVGNRQEWNGKGVNELGFEVNLPQLEHAKKHEISDVSFSSDLNVVYAYAGIRLGQSDNALRSAHIGTLFLRYDLAADKRKAWQMAMQQGLASWLVLVVLSGIIFLLFRRYISKRLAYLMSVVDRLRKGEANARAHLLGKDEIAQLGASLDEMADHLLANQAELERQQAEILATSARYQTLFAASRDGLILLDRDNHIIDVNPSLCQLFQLDKNQLTGSLCQSWLANEMDSMLRQRLNSLLSQVGQANQEIELVLDNRQGGRCEVAVRFFPYVQGDSVRGTWCVLRDISERRAQERRMRYLAEHDELTGLANRPAFLDSLASIVQQAAARQRHLSLLFVDLDRFKQVNDTLGHAIGDLLLKAVAERISHFLGENGFAARQGGDEFLLCLPEYDAQQAEQYAVILAHELSQPYRIADYTLNLTPSIGICAYPEHAEEPDELIRYADVAMYQAKLEGRNACRVFSHQLRQRMTERLALENGLREAISKKQFFLVYQPQLGVAEQRVIGVEVLLRWQHPHLGLVPPMRFIPVAEETGLIHQIGDWVLEETCRQLAQWQQEGITLSAAVNLSAVQFSDANLVDRVSELIQHYQLNPERLELELTESMLMGDIEQAIRTLQQLAGLGVKLSIDDFGTGYSSLSYIKRLPINQLKIDRSFVIDLETDPHARAIAETVLAMARTLGLEVVAEGVENVKQAAFLREHGCQILQGYWLSRPLPIAEFAPWLTRPLPSWDD